MYGEEIQTLIDEKMAAQKLLWQR